MRILNKILHTVIIAVLWFFNPLNIQSVFSQSDDIYGLKFSSYEVQKDLRTSLDLTSDGPLDVRKSFTLSFSFRYNRNYSAYGYIFRLITDKAVNFDLLSKTSSLLDNDIEFVAGSNHTNIHYDINDIANDPVIDWIHSVIHFDLEKNTIAIDLNGVVRTDTFKIDNIKDIRIVFGANNYNRFSTSDVPPITLKDIRFESDGKYKRYWKLDQHGSLKVIDLAGRREAEVINPEWVVDDHSKWKLKYTLTTEQFPQIAFDKKNSKIFIVEDDHMQIVNLSSDSILTVYYRSGRPFKSQSNQLIYNPYKNELWQYIINSSRIAKYDFKTRTWNNNDQASPEPAYWHHNKFFSAVDHKLTTFGGYGFYSYKNQLFRLDEESGVWDQIPVDGFIKPRYLGALGYSTRPDEILIFGGYGNESGRQELSPETLYDLNLLNLKNFRLKKLWELDNVEVSFALSNSLIVDSAKNCFYVLCYPVHKYSTTLFLSRFPISNPEMTVISDSIPYFFQDTESFCDLYYSGLTKELITVTSRYLGNNQSEVQIYSLEFPPVKPKSIQLKEVTAGHPVFNRVIFFMMIIILAGTLALMFRKRLKPVTLLKKRVLNSDNNTSISPDINNKERDSSSDPDLLHSVTGSGSGLKSSIQFLGDFQIIDKGGSNITGLFTPTLKQLFVIILLSSGESGKGVSSVFLKDNIWFGKSKDSARNIRGVYIRKLRMLLDKTGDLKLVNNNSNWTISVGSDVYFDYGRVSQLLKKIRQMTEVGHNIFNELVMLGTKGPLLPNLEYDWLDKHKADYSSEIIDVLLEFSKKPDIQNDIKLIIQIADAVFSNDPLNEEALKLKCKVLNDNGKHSLAKNVYESFSREYLNSMGSNFDRSFGDLIL